MKEKEIKADKERLENYLVKVDEYYIS